MTSKTDKCSAVGSLYAYKPARPVTTIKQPADKITVLVLIGSCKTAYPQLRRLAPVEHFIAEIGPYPRAALRLNAESNS